MSDDYKLKVSLELSGSNHSGKDSREQGTDVSNPRREITNSLIEPALF